MYQDIFVGILCVIAAAAGIWVWRLDHAGASQDPANQHPDQNEEK